MRKIIICLTFLYIGFTLKAQITELPNGNVGVGTTAPVTKLDVRGNVTVETNTSPHLYTGTGSLELNRFLLLLNSSQRRSASGLKAGGILVSDTYAFANPSKNDLIVKGKTGIGTAIPITKLDVRGNLTLETNNNPHIYTGTGSAELNRFLLLLNSSERRSASGLKAGGLLVSDTYAYANPSKNDLIVKGKAGIGTTNTGSHRLAVNGSVGAREVVVESGTWSDFVFYNDYQLPTLEEVENHIKLKGHLKDIPSASEVEENGISLGEMDAKLLQKIEELTLYILQQDKRIKKLENQLKEK